jgi:glycogen operon protein
MLYAGDESERTQQRLANAYDQDNERSWLEWELTPDKQALLDFTRAVIALVQHHPVLRRRHFWHGQRLPGSVRKALAWFRPDGLEMLAEDWQAPENRYVGLLRAGEGDESMPTRRTRRHKETVLLLLNAQPQAVSFVLPALQESGVWEVLVWTDDSLVPPPSPSPRTRSAPYRPSRWHSSSIPAEGVPGAMGGPWTGRGTQMEIDGDGGHTELDGDVSQSQERGA